MLAEWFGSALEGKEMLRRLEIVESEYVKQALRLYANFVQIMKLRKVQVSSGQKAWASPVESESFWPISPATTHRKRKGNEISAPCSGNPGIMEASIPPNTVQEDIKDGCIGS
jgi:hypothetical protein